MKKPISCLISILLAGIGVPLPMLNAAVNTPGNDIRFSMQAFAARPPSISTDLQRTHWAPALDFQRYRQDRSIHEAPLEPRLNVTAGDIVSIGGKSHRVLKLSYLYGKPSVLVRLLSSPNQTIIIAGQQATELRTITSEYSREVLESLFGELALTRDADIARAFLRRLQILLIERNDLDTRWTQNEIRATRQGPHPKVGDPSKSIESYNAQEGIRLDEIIKMDGRVKEIWRVVYKNINVVLLKLRERFMSDEIRTLVDLTRQAAEPSSALTVWLAAQDVTLGRATGSTTRRRTDGRDRDVVRSSVRGSGVDGYSLDGLHAETRAAANHNPVAGPIKDRPRYTNAGNPMTPGHPTEATILSQEYRLAAGSILETPFLVKETAPPHLLETTRISGQEGLVKDAVFSHYKLVLPEPVTRIFVESIFGLEIPLGSDVEATLVMARMGAEGTESVFAVSMTYNDQLRVMIFHDEKDPLFKSFKIIAPQLYRRSKAVEYLVPVHASLEIMSHPSKASPKDPLIIRLSSVANVFEVSPARAVDLPFKHAFLSSIRRFGKSYISTLPARHVQMEAPEEAPQTQFIRFVSDTDIQHIASLLHNAGWGFLLEFMAFTRTWISPEQTLYFAYGVSAEVDYESHAMTITDILVPDYFVRIPSSLFSMLLSTYYPEGALKRVPDSLDQTIRYSLEALAEKWPKGRLPQLTYADIPRIMLTTILQVIGGSVWSMLKEKAESGEFPEAEYLVRQWAAQIRFHVPKSAVDAVAHIEAHENMESGEVDFYDLLFRNAFAQLVDRDTFLVEFGSTLSPEIRNILEHIRAFFKQEGVLAFSIPLDQAA